MTTPKKKRPRDISQLAASIVADATTGGRPEKLHDGTSNNPAAVALGRLGGLKGGPARKKKLSAKRRIEIAKKAAKARWGKSAKRKPS